jgi:hypothetical protein
MELNLLIFQGCHAELVSNTVHLKMMEMNVARFMVLESGGFLGYRTYCIFRARGLFFPLLETTFSSRISSIIEL